MFINLVERNVGAAIEPALTELPDERCGHHPAEQ